MPHDPPVGDAPMHSAPMRFPVLALGGLPEDVRGRPIAVQEKSGSVPDVFLLLARRPDEFRAFLAYHDLLWTGRGRSLRPSSR